jgi:hypothetical protein
MVPNKPKTRRDSSSQIETPRTASYMRFRSPTQREDDSASGSGAPSTLPPPPFEHEVAVRALEWWLDAHMALAAELLWLEQLMEATPDGGAHADTVRVLSVQTEAVRDALYELYCDAADERMIRVLGRDAALQKHVRDCYAWCARVVGLLVSVLGGLRSENGPDWAGAKALFRLASMQRAALSPANLAGARALAIDYASPVEPLRNLPNDLDTLVASVQQLHGALEKRFG